MQGEEMIEEYLREYDGEDRVVRSTELIKLLKETRANAFRVSSGFKRMEEAVQGFEGGELIVISGPTKNGKTLLAQSLTVQFAEQRKYPLWFTFEVTIPQFFARFPMIPRLTAPLKLYHHDIDWLENRIVESYLKYGTQIVFIDHLHYLIDMAQSKNLSVDIGAVIRRLKGIAVERDMVIFLLCHTTKGGPGKRCSYSSIRDSSFVAQESDCVIMVVRDPGYHENAAVATVEFHRRTGVMERKIALIKDGDLLREDGSRVPRMAESEKDDE